MIATWWGLALVALGVAAVAMVLTAYAAKRVGRVSVVDVTWGLALAAIAVVMAVVGTGTPWRRWLVAVLVLAIACCPSANEVLRWEGLWRQCWSFF